MSAAERAASWIATFFGIGLLRGPRGTWGSLAALPPAWVLASLLGPLALLPAGFAVASIGVWASQVHARRLGIKDPSEIVIDEVAGQWITLSLVALDPAWWVLGFCLFRVCDILKPWPASRIDRTWPGGWGVMLDDVVAGIYAAILLWIFVKALP